MNRGKLFVLLVAKAATLLLRPKPYGAIVSFDAAVVVEEQTGSFTQLLGRRPTCTAPG